MALTKLIFLALLSGTLIFENFYVALSVFGFAFFLWVYYRLPASFFFKGSLNGGGRFLTLLLILICAADYYTSKDCFHTLVKTLSYLDLIMLCVCFVKTVSPSALLHVLGHGRFSITVALTLSLIPLIVQSISQTVQARKARGEKFFRHPFKALTSLSICVISSLLDRVDSYSDALISRGAFRTVKTIGK